MKKYMIYSVVFLMSFILFYGCGGGSEENPTVKSSTYATTSTRGDYTEWTLAGSSLTALWQVVNDTGGIDYTFNFDAVCGEKQSSGIRDCNFTTVTCSDRLEVCPGVPSGTFRLMDVPNVALFVDTSTARGVSVTDQLHVGFATDTSSCDSDVSGDYIYMKLGHGSRNIFGLYRSDANLVNILHTDFGFSTVDANIHQTLTYNTHLEAETFRDIGCTDGMRLRESSGLSIIRTMVTGSGLFVLDLPAGEGGVLSFKVENVASVADLANKHFGGYSFPDNDDPQLQSLTTGSVVNGRVTFTHDDPSYADPVRIMHLDTADMMTSPAYVDFGIPPRGYSASTLWETYPDIDSIPGLFKVDGLDDQGRVILAGMRYNDKTILFGAVYNYRLTTDINPSTGTFFSENNLYNTGSFILFEQ